MSETSTRRTLSFRTEWAIEVGETECLDCWHRGVGVEDPDYCVLFKWQIVDGKRCPACLGAEEGEQGGGAHCDARNQERR